MINRPAFFNRLKTYNLFANANNGVIEGCNAILDEWERQGLTDIRWLAYMLATVYHETNTTMQPIEEIGKGAGKDYGKKLKYGLGPGKRVAYTTPNKIYYGRGLVQLTWYELYEKIGKLLGIDLLNNPELACTLSVAVKIMFCGMQFGLFTGVGLKKYFNATTNDPLHARQIINLMNCAEKIEMYYEKFMKCLQ